MRVSLKALSARVLIYHAERVSPMVLSCRYCITRRCSAWNQFSPDWVLGELRTRAFASSHGSSGIEVFKGREDRYNGFIVDPDRLPEDPSAFSQQLDHSLQVGQKLQMLIPMPGTSLLTSCTE